METARWKEDLARRLERAADRIDDVANSDWIVSEDLRDALFAVEARAWRFARQLPKIGSDDPLAWLGGITEIHRALLSCLLLDGWRDEDTRSHIESVAREVASSTHLLAEARPAPVGHQRLAVGGTR